MTARISEAEARALGLDVKAARQRTTRKAVTGGPYRTRCVACREVFPTEAAETRHVEQVGHHRYELVIG